MNTFKKIFLTAFIILIPFNLNAIDPKSTGKFKNWESFVLNSKKGKICFAQTIPVKRVPSSIKRNDSRIFVTFRPVDNVRDEISVTSGHTYKTSSVTGKSGKSSYSFFSQNNFGYNKF